MCIDVQNTYLQIDCNNKIIKLLQTLLCHIVQLLNRRWYKNYYANLRVHYNIEYIHKLT